jgi:hypothetical protein
MVLLGRLWRLFLTAALLVATQSSLLHPFDHLRQARSVQCIAGVSSLGDTHPFETLHGQVCNVCVVGAALGAAASLDSPTAPILSARDRAFARRKAAFLSAFSPLFRSQAPPALL